MVRHAMGTPLEPGEQPAGMPVMLDARYLGPVERPVAHAASEVRLLAALSPRNAAEERARLTSDLRAGRAPIPRWTYTPRDHGSLRRALEAAEGALDRLGAAPLANE